MSSPMEETDSVGDQKVRTRTQTFTPMDKESIIEFFPSDDEKTFCHYCRSPSIPYHHRLVIMRMSPEDLEELFHAGWLRSAMVLFKPNVQVNCCRCREYNTVTSALDFQLSKSHRKTLRKFTNYLEGSSQAQAQAKAKVNPKTQDTSPLKNLEDYFIKWVAPTCQRKLRIQTHRLNSPALWGIFYEEVEVYEKYLYGVHGLTLGDSVVENFKTQYCISPLASKDPVVNNSSGPYGPGTYHQIYYIDEAMIAVGVIDVTPGLIISVAFFYDPKYKHLRIGTIGSLLEIGYVRFLHQKVDPTMAGYSMGVYVPTYSKFQYKAHFQPCYVLRSISNIPRDWVLLGEELRKSLENGNEIPPEPPAMNLPSPFQKEYRKIQRILTFPFVGRIVTATGYQFEVMESKSEGNDLHDVASTSWMTSTLSTESESSLVAPEYKADVEKYCTLVGDLMARRLVRLIPITLTHKLKK